MKRIGTIALTLLLCVLLFGAVAGCTAGTVPAPDAEQLTAAQTDTPEPTEPPTEAPTMEPTPEPTATPTPEPTEEPTPTPIPTPAPERTLTFSNDLMILKPGRETKLSIFAEDKALLKTDTDVSICLSDGTVVGSGTVGAKNSGIRITLPETAPARTTLYLFAAGSDVPLDVKDVAVIDETYEKILGNYERDDKMVALTFDCAYGETYTDWILDTLKEYGIHVTFFMTGRWMGNHGPWIEHMIEDGHELGNHSMTHPRLTNVDARKIEKEIQGPIDILLERHGYRTHLFRCPYGAGNDKVNAISRYCGCEVIQWGQTSKDAHDWEGERIIELVLKEVEPGDIILFHNGAPQVKIYLKPIIETLTERGYTFGTVSELMGWEWDDTYSAREQMKAGE